MNTRNLRKAAKLEVMMLQSSPSIGVRVGWARAPGSITALD